MSPKRTADLLAASAKTCFGSLLKPKNRVMQLQCANILLLCLCVLLAQLLNFAFCITMQEECLNLQRDLVQARSALVRSNHESQSRLADAESRVKAVEADAEVSSTPWLGPCFVAWLMVDSCACRKHA